MVDFNPTIGHYCNDGGLTFDASSVKIQKML